jgi:hypothetical protein
MKLEYYIQIQKGCWIRTMLTTPTTSNIIDKIPNKIILIFFLI